MDCLGESGAFRLMFEFLKDIGNYESRKLANDTVDCGLEVSTAFTSDEGWETAIIDSNGVHPVARYLDKQEAIIGHTQWLKFAQDAVGKTITKLGGLGLTGTNQVVLQGRHSSSETSHPE